MCHPPTHPTPPTHLPVQVRGERLHLVPRTRRCAAEKVKRGTRWEHALLLLPARVDGQKQGAQGQLMQWGLTLPHFTSALRCTRTTHPATHPHSPLPHHLSACPTSAMRREGGTVDTSLDSACASCARRLSRRVLPYSSRASK